ncbi:MAG: hypothetical protein AB4042_20810, partial [Leptolyngbyaceae cyanobacterium]
VTLSGSNVFSFGNFSVDSNLLRVQESSLSILGDTSFDNGELRITRNSDFFTLGSLNIENNDFLLRESEILALDLGDSLEEGGILEDLGGLLDDEIVNFLLGDRVSTIRDTLNMNSRSRGISIMSRDNQVFDNSQILVGTLAGQGRDIQLAANQLDISNSSRIIMFSTRDSQQGNLSLNADQIHIEGMANSEEIENPTELIPNIVGIFNFDDSTAGNLDIETNELSIADSSLVVTLTFGKRAGGNIGIDATQLTINGADGNSLFPSFLAAVAVGQEDELGVLPSGGDITINAGEVSVEAGGNITTTTVSGPGGQILVEADAVRITGRRPTENALTSSSISSESYGQGDGGTVIIRSHSINIDESGDVATSSRRPQGSLFGEENRDRNTNRIDIFSEAFSRLDDELRSRIPSVDFLDEGINLLIGLPVSQFLGEGEIDNPLVFNLNDFLPNISDIFQERIDAEVEIDRPGNAGNIFLDVDNLSLRSGSELFSRTRAIGDGGNIHLLVDDFLLVDESNIGTTAGTDGAGGDGGNITIRADNGFIVGVGNGNIAANAFTGNGGNVNITTQEIFGLEFRDQATVLSDITASSVFGQDGEVLITTLNVDVTRGLVALPDQPVDPELSSTCQVGGSAAVEFFVIGRGGSPPTPDDMLDASGAPMASDPAEDWIPLVATAAMSRPRSDDSGLLRWAGSDRLTGGILPRCQIGPRPTGQERQEGDRQ